MNVSLLFPWRPEPDRIPIFKWVLARWEAVLPGAQCITGNSPPGAFNRSAAINDAASVATGDVLVLADADTTFSSASIMREAVESVAAREVPWAVPYFAYFNLDQPATIGLLAVEPHAGNVADPETFDHRLLDSVSGINVIRREDWETIGGMDERFVDWGYEDRAFQATADVLLGPHQRSPGSALHFWHTPGLRFDNPHADANRLLAARYQTAARQRSAQKIHQLIAEARMTARAKEESWK